MYSITRYAPDRALSAVWKSIAAAALILSTSITAHAQLYRLASASDFTATAGLIDFEDALLVNPSYSVSTSMGPVGVDTGSGFVGETYSTVGGIPTLSSGPSGITPALNPMTPPGPESHDVWTYKETVSHDPEVRGPGVLMSDFQSNGPVSILFSTPVAAVGFELANYQFPSTGSDFAGAYQIFAYGVDGALLGTFANLQDDTVYSDVSTYEFVGFATTSGAPLIKGFTVASLSGSSPDSSVTHPDNRIDNLRFGSARDLVGGAVPEPSTYGLFAGAALLAMIGSRRKRRNSTLAE